MKKRIFALAMALICLASCVLSLSACAKPDDDKPSGNVEANLDHLKGLDFGGQEINFIIASADGDHYHLTSIYVDEESDDGDGVNSEIYKRNEKVQSMLGVEIVVAAEDNNSITSQAKTVLLAGTSDYDVIAARQYDDIALALEGVILDLNTLGSEYNADYIKWEEEYWATSYIDALTFGNKNFWLTGDLCLRYTGGFYSMFVNTRLYDDLLKPDYGSIYDIVNNKQWTYEKLMDMVSRCYVDDGDEKPNPETDQMGLLLPVWDNTNGMAISAGCVFTTYDENGTPQNAFLPNNKNLISFLETFNKLLGTVGVWSFNVPSSSYKEAFQYFAGGASVFVAGRLNQAELYLREMEDDYYVIPCPMLNEDQGAYYTGIHDAINIYGINASSENIPAAAATLEAMAYESYYRVRPVYYDSFLKFKYTRDDEAAGMIDLMHDTVYTDFVFIWQFSNDLSGMGEWLRRNVKSNNASSTLKKMSDKWNNGLDQILDKIEQSAI